MTPFPSLMRRCALLLVLLFAAVACGVGGGADTEDDTALSTVSEEVAADTDDTEEESVDTTATGEDNTAADEAEMSVEASPADAPISEVPEEYVLGWINPLSGTSALFGEMSRNATELALADINDEGGINGAEMRIIYEDNEFQVDATITAFERLMREEVPVVLTAGSSMLFALSPLAETNEVVLANIGAQSPELITDAHPWVYNFIPTSGAEGLRLAERIYQDLGLTRMAVILADNDYGVDTSEAFISAYEELGGEIVHQERHEVGATDMRTQLIQIRGEEPEGLLIISSVGEVGHIVAQARELGLEVPLFGVTFSLSPDNFEIAGSAMEGMRGVAVTFEGTEGVGQDFGGRFEEMHDVAPTVYAAVAYDAVRIVADAIRDVGDEPAAIGDYLLGVEDFEGVMGSTTMSANREVQFPLQEWEIVDGEVVPWE